MGIIISFSAPVSLGLLVSMNIIQSHNAVEALAPVIIYILVYRVSVHAAAVNDYLSVL